MGWSSALLSQREIIIDESTPDHHAFLQPPPGFSKGLLPGFRQGGKQLEELGTVIDFPRELLIPRNEWQARIQEKQEMKTQLSDIALQAGLPCKDQNGTNYCWINGVIYSMELYRICMGLAMKILSCGYAGAIIKNYRNVGGWGEEAIEHLTEFGTVPVELVPANAINRKYETTENAAIALTYRIIQWVRVRPRNQDELTSALLRNLPLAVGYNWWGHLVNASDAVWIDGTIATRIRNSWSMSWGEKGFGILKGSKQLPDGVAVSPYNVAA